MTSEANETQRQRIGRYEILSELGRGGMGVVYRAEDPMIGRDVAIKTLTEVTPELKERFYVEARSGILSHPNIVTVYELGDSDGTPFIAMEFLPGESLERLLQASKRIPLTEALLITEQLCAGLGYAHQHGLVHRDVKPANTMVLPDGRVKIVDFGIARLADQTTRLTRADALLGTFHYIAPERLKGETSDGRADIWSVGVMLYEMVTGELPFRGKDVSALYRVMHEPYIPLRERIEGAPESLTAIVDRALAKDVASRYGTTEEMQVDLQKVREELKREHVEELLESVRQLMQERRFANARAVAVQVQRIDTGNTIARELMLEAQDQLDQLQRSEQLRQTWEEAEAAFAGRQFEDALSLYAQAGKLDEDRTLPVEERMVAVRQASKRARSVRLLQEQASEARGHGDLTGAQALLQKALDIDDRSTELRQAHSLLLRDIRQREERTLVEHLLQDARQKIGDRQYTEAMADLRRAAEVDPTHEDVQQLLLSTTARQKEERRRQALEQVVGEIQESLQADNLTQARSFVTRALETLPNESVLLRLKVEVDQRERDREVEALVRTAMLTAQDLWEQQPDEAISALDEALLKAPGENRLLQFRSRLEEHQEQRRREERRAARLTQARNWMEQGRPGDAALELEAAALDCGETEELTALLLLAREQREALQKQTEREERMSELQRLLGEERFAEVLQRYPEDGSDAELGRLRAIAARNLQEIEARVTAVIARARATAETDLKGAMRLLDEQPDHVKRSQAVLALCAELTSRDKKDKAIAQAVEQSEISLRSGDFAKSDTPINKLAATYGAQDPQVVASLKTFATRRQDAADAEVRRVLQHAQGALERGAAKEALREAKKVRGTAVFATAGLRDELKELEARAMTERSQRRAEGNVQSATDGRGASRWIAAAAVFVLLIGGFLLIHRRHGEQDSKAVLPGGQQHSGTNAVPPAAPAVRASAASTGSAELAMPEKALEDPSNPGKLSLEVDASPWGTVTDVTDAQGQKLDLPGDGAGTPTPFRMDGLNAGTYQVTVQSPGGEQRDLQCSVSATDHLCTTEFAAPDIARLLKGDRR